MAEKLTRLPSGDPALDRVQQHIVDGVNRVIASLPAPAAGASLLPTGTLLPFAGATAPNGFLLCDGAAVSRKTYAGLFAAIGTTYGTGDGSLTFNLPDFRSRLPVGAGQGSGLTIRALGATGGEEAHALSQAELASHAHTASTGTESAAHTHPLGVGASDSTTVVTGVERYADHVGGFGSTIRATGTPSATHTHAVTVNATGSGTAHNTMPPFLAVNWIIAT